MTTKFILKTFHSEIKIDEDEVAKVLEALKSGDVKVLRQGIFNPQSFDSIVPDEKRSAQISEVESKVYTRIEDGIVHEYTLPAKNSTLPDLFADIRESLQAGENKKLN